MRITCLCAEKSGDGLAPEVSLASPPTGAVRPCFSSDGRGQALRLMSALLHVSFFVSYKLARDVFHWSDERKDVQ